MNFTISFKSDMNLHKNVFWSLGGIEFFSAPKIYPLSGWVYCFWVSSAGVLSPRADALQLLRLGIQSEWRGQEQHCGQMVWTQPVTVAPTLCCPPECMPHAMFTAKKAVSDLPIMALWVLPESRATVEVRALVLVNDALHVYILPISWESNQRQSQLSQL